MVEQKLWIKKICIKNLFNKYNYEIDLENGNNVSILIAPNGCGKTTVFNILDFIFHPTSEKFIRIKKIPFDEVNISLSNNKEIVLTSNLKTMNQSINSNDEQSYREALWNEWNDEWNELKELKKEFNSLIGTEDSKREELLPEATYIRRRLNSLNRSTFDSDGIQLNKNERLKISQLYKASSDRTLKIQVDNQPTFTILSNDELKYRLQRVNIHDYRESKSFVGFNEMIAILKESECYVDVRFISANRIYDDLGLNGLNAEKQGTVNKVSEHYGKSQPKSLFKQIFENEKILYFNGFNKFAEMQNGAKDDLIKRYLHSNNSKPDYNCFLEKWNEYINKLKMLSKMGLLNNYNELMNNEELEKAYKDKGDFISIYLDLFTDSIEPLIDIARKREIMKKYFDEHNAVTGKELIYDKEIMMVLSNGEELPIECLSSGEKHDLVMLWIMLNWANPNTMLLIDEPEISLHINWQETFLDSLKEILDLNGGRAIVATHSPNIINGHFEMLAKKGIEYDE